MKPFGIDDLRRVVERVLAERRTQTHGREALSVVQEENESLRRERRETAERHQGVQRDLKLSRRDLERRVRDLELVAELTHLLTGQDVERIVAMTAQITARRFHAHVTRIEADVGTGMVEAEHREGADPVALPLPLGALLAERARGEIGGRGPRRGARPGTPARGHGGRRCARRASPAGSVIVLLRPLLPSKDEQDLALLGMIARAHAGPRGRAQPPPGGGQRRRGRPGMLEAIEGRGAVRRGPREPRVRT